MADTAGSHITIEEAAVLPTKRGEIGFNRDEEESRTEVDLASGVGDVMNAGPHPAEQPPLPSGESSPPEPILTRPSDSSESLPALPTRSDAPSTLNKRRVVFFQRLRSLQPNKHLGGISNATAVRMLAVLAILGGTIALWIFALKIIRIDNSSSSSSSSTDDNPQDGTMTFSPSIIFIHITFAIACLIVLILFERVVYQARAERFAFLNPGAIPRYRHRRGLSTSSRMEDGPSENDARRGILFMPWNRPSLPTYAATMNHRGTGDVEDEIIAAPPPPAYGNTRGSTLLMLGVPALREGQQPVPDSPPPPISRSASWTASLRSYMSSGTNARRVDEERAQGRGKKSNGGGDDSTMSDDAARAIALGEALAKLEEGSSPQPSSSSLKTEGRR